VEKSLVKQLTDKGYALPSLGGMDQQTIGGFMSTGSSGGTQKYGFSSCIEEIHLLTANGEVLKLTKDDDRFYAAGTSMGLLGIIIYVLIVPIPTYFVEGTEENFTTSGSALESGETLIKNIQERDYFHLAWVPSADRVDQWQGMQISPHSKPVPYTNPLSKTLPFLIAQWVFNLADKGIIPKFRRWLIQEMFPLSKPQSFSDSWGLTLPNDDGAVNAHKALNYTQFTEIWFPLGSAKDVLDRLKAELKKDPTLEGDFAIEMYSAPKSPFWLSPAYDRDVFRLDPYWWSEAKKSNPHDFFTKYWNIFLPFSGARLHQGKWQPKPGQNCGGITWNLRHLQSLYPKLGEFLKLREELDPLQLFVSPYWRGLFEIPQKSKI